MADYTQGSRQVTLRWDNPTMQGQSGIQIIKDNTDITNIDEVVRPATSSRRLRRTSTCRIPSRPAIATDACLKGQTVRFNIAYEVQKGGNKVAMLLPNDYATGSADESAAADWFKRTYVDAGKGVILTPATIDDLDIESQSACWVMCDRIGIGNAAGRTSPATSLRLRPSTP